MSSVFIEPLDVLALRGNKLFGDDPGSYGESMVPPWPSVAAGAIRSAILARDGDPAAFARGEWTHPELGTPRVPGPFTVTAFHLARKNGRIEPLFEPPADLAIISDDGTLTVRPMHPSKPAYERASSNPLPLMPVLAQEKRTKSVPGQWLTVEGWRAYLAAEPIKPHHLVPSNELWASDLRVGVGLSPVTRHAEEGKLFSANTIAFKQETGFLARIAGADLAAGGVLRFGGDGHAARMQVVEVDWPEPDYEALAEARRARLVLTAPGLFERGWLPTGSSLGADALMFDLHGVRGKLACAAVPRPNVVSGFDLARWRPKPAQRIAPAGSVYWLDELESAPATLRKLVEIGLWPVALHNDARRPEGFNRVTFATWNRDHV